MPNFKTDFYKRLFQSLDNNAVIMQVEDDGTYYPVWCSREFTEMMEGTEEDVIRLESSGSGSTVYPDDLAEVAYLVRHHRARDGSNSLVIRKRTVKGNELWVKVHYAFVTEDGVQYAYCNYSDITAIKKAEQEELKKKLKEQERAQTIYSSMMEQFNVIADESLTVIRSNLTTGVIEEVRGRDLYPSDFAGNDVSAYARTRKSSFLREEDRKKYEEIFDVDKMLDRAARGLGPVTWVACCRRASGRQCFVKFSGSASRDPLTGDVNAFGIETEYNSEIVAEVMNEEILARQYDMVTYIVDGYYGVTIGDGANISRGSIFPRQRDGIYMDYIRKQVLPVVAEGQRETIRNALSLETVAQKLENGEPYSVDVACSIDGETFYKRFTYYAVDRESQFYILLKSDITDVIRDQGEREQTQATYNSMLDQFNAMADQSLTVQRTNLTTGLIEEARGTDLYDTDFAGGSIVRSAQIRSESFLIEGDREKYEETFALDKLLERTASGRGPATFVGYCRRRSGRQCFVKFSGSASRSPLTGDVIAFGVETEYNTEMVNEVMDEKVLAQQYDMITYIVSGYYSVAIGDGAGISRGSIFPKERNGVYMDYIRTQVLPVLAGTEEEKAAMEAALSLEAIEAALAVDEPYITDVACRLDGEIFNKRFMFYTVDRERHFYILLKSDITDVLKEQREQNELLATALREAEHANAAKTAFLSNMSHEIRTPMNAIIGLDNIALNDPTISDTTRDYLEKIGSSANHLLGIINDILDMSRIESGRMVIKSEEFSFAKALAQVNTIINGQCRDKGIQYDCRVIGKVDDYYIGDDMKLRQVMINILGNAVKFTPEGGVVTFTVEEIARYDGKSTLRLIISDTGIGMSEEFLPKLFDAFAQEDSSSTNRYGSTGLGMPITKSIVELMNGAIDVKSRKGEGTTFTVTVTMLCSERRKDLEDAGAFHPDDLCVLVIDDDPIACEHAQVVLGQIGIHCEKALSGAEGLEMTKLRYARREPYNLILVDWRMPEMDGVETTRQIRAAVGNEIPVIILTSYSWEDIEEEATAAGVDTFVAKPLFAGSVLDEFREAFHKKSAQLEKQTADLKGRRILLAEDMQVNAEIMMMVLAMREMEVEHAENGRIAVDMFSESALGYYDAILMDMRMPEMDGLEATRAIRRLDRKDAGQIPIIALTANAFDEDVQRSMQAGLNAHLSKPVEPEALFATLERLIKV